MNWYQPCAYDNDQKRAFHSAGRKRLAVLARALGYEPGSFDLCSSTGCIAALRNVNTS